MSVLGYLASKVTAFRRRKGDVKNPIILLNEDNEPVGVRADFAESVVAGLFDDFNDQFGLGARDSGEQADRVEVSYGRLPVGRGYTADNGESKLSVVLGEYGRDCRSVFDRDYMPVDVFVSLLVAANHELCHCEQCLNEFRTVHVGTDDIVKSIEHMAREGNDSYYLGDRYVRWAREMEAEHAGVVCTRDQLFGVLAEDVPGEKQRAAFCERLLLEYAESCTVSDDGKQAALYQIDPTGCWSVKDLSDRFRDAYDRSCRAKPHSIYMLAHGRNDLAAGCMLDPSWSVPKDVMLTEETTGNEQDKLVAAINGQARPGLQERFPQLRGVDLSGEAVCGSPFPAVPDAVGVRPFAMDAAFRRQMEVAAARMGTVERSERLMGGRRLSERVSSFSVDYQLGS